ncbi:hypothetical protein [Labilibacter marinus]|uniref:hypothetical protein n=1 Tax=Labilibacter marinus TaxID=1477105 RepID=UPI00094F9AF5|nr:hypothetical protein [Labilibacter marinus]
MHYTKHTKVDYLYKLRDITSMSINVEDIRNVVKGYGYDSVKLAEGKKMAEELERLNDEVNKKNGLKKTMFAQKKTLQTEIHKKYMKFLKLSRIAFIDDVEAQESLLLMGARARTYEKWLAQVVVFVNNVLANAEYVKALKGYGVTKAEVKLVQQKVDELNSLSSECIKITGVVRMLNHKIKKETVVMQHWLSSYIKVARIAMDENPKVGKLIKQAIGA